MAERARGASATERIAAAVVNGTGYGGVELLRLLRRHPAFEIVEVTARSEVGKRVSEVFPQLVSLDVPFTPSVEQAEVVFVALPEHAAVEIVPDLLAAGRRVVDLSAGFRLRDPAQYQQWYGFEHPAPALLEEAVYGLTEWARPALADARLVACPGCYPTAALLALAPALAHGLLEHDSVGALDVIVDAKSGISGAGRALKLGSHYSEANEDVSAYGLLGHRHQPEIMCRDDKRTLRPEGADGREHLPGGCTLDACRRFIQQEDVWRCEHRTRDAQPAALTPREGVAVFT